MYCKETSNIKQQQKHRDFPDFMLMKAKFEGAGENDLFT